MSDYFRGWRRKVGVMTLVMACLFMVGWFRSQTRFEYIDFSFGNVSYGVTSMHSGLAFSRTMELDPTSVLDFIDFKSVELFIKPQDPFNGTPWSRHQAFNSTGGGIGQGFTSERASMRPGGIKISWSLTGPSSFPSPLSLPSCFFQSPLARLKRELTNPSRTRGRESWATSSNRGDERLVS